MSCSTMVCNTKLFWSVSIVTAFTLMLNVNEPLIKKSFLPAEGVVRCIEDVSDSVDGRCLGELVPSWHLIRFKRF